AVKQPDRDDLRALRDKYERIRALREQSARARLDPAFVPADPRPALSRLAQEFPGALRDVDLLPLPAVAARIDALAAAEGDAGRVEPWMVAQVTFHRYARSALAAKRWLGGTKDVTPELADAFAASAPDAHMVADVLP